MPVFSIEHTAPRGRLGQISFEAQDKFFLETPHLYPVAVFLTGTTPNGGGIWKYILQADRQNGLLRRNISVLSQALHFLDYKLSPKSVREWRERSIRRRYNEEVLHRLDYKAPFFLDSGGFQLMWRQGLNLEPYGITLGPNTEVESILRLQQDLGGSLIASLDYPIHDQMSPADLASRTNKSRENGINALRFLQEKVEFQNFRPLLYLAVHGLSTETIIDYVTSLFHSLENNDVDGINIGLAIGSLVPLRSSQKSDRIMQLVWSAVRAIPEEYRGRIPFHIFGMTGLLIPFLAYCGIDTFDSSTYAQEASRLIYFMPETYQRYPILELTEDEFVCECNICRNMSLHKLQEALVTPVKNRQPLPNGEFKSKFYADIALHNLELDFVLVERTKQAIRANELDNYLIEIARSIPRMRSALDALCELDENLRRKALRFLIPINKRPHKTKEPIEYVTMTHTSRDFDIRTAQYTPTGSRSILLIIPCSKDKPYSESRTHKFLAKRLQEELPGAADEIEKITLSGLYGPVPVAYENVESVLHYDFLLIPSNEAQIRECTDRLVLFLEEHGERYKHCIAYGTSSAYRTVFEKAARRYQALKVFPDRLKSRRVTEFYRASNIDQLINYLREALQRVDTQAAD